MHADPAMTDEYVPPGLVYKVCLFLALAAGGALIVPVHMLTAKKAAAGDDSNASVATKFPDRKTAKSYGPVQIAAATPSFSSFGNPFPSAPLPSEQLPAEPMPLEAMPLELEPEQAIAFEPAPYELTPSAQGSNGALHQPPAIDEEFIFQEEPAQPVAEVDPVPAPPVAVTEAVEPKANEAIEPMPAIAVQATESPSDAAAMPMPAVAETMPAPVVEATPAPVVDMLPVDVAPIPAHRPITCTSPVPEPVVLRATSSQPPQLPQAYSSPMQQGPMKQAPTTTQPKQAAQPRPQVYRPAAPQPQPQQRQTFNHPGYGTSNIPTYSR